MKEIVQDGGKVLREIAKPVPDSLFGSAELSQLIRDMSEALDHFPEGVAIAAPQIGVSYRLFLVRKDRTLPSYGNAKDGKPPPEIKPEIEVYINPEIVKTSRKKAKADEGCLSVHGVYGTTKRHERVTIKARGADGSHIMRGAGGLMAQIFEHEIDHLNGILFIDHAEHLLRIPHGAEHPFAYFGTPRVAADTLATIIENGFVPAVVVTSPDSRRGRGLALTPPETKTLAVANNIPVMTPEKLDTENVAAISAFGCEYAVCVAYGKIFPEELISTFPRGVLNVHYSLLPKYRGATPLETALLSGENETGVTIQKMVKELDAGDIIAQEATSIGNDETAKELRPRLIEMGANLLAETLPRYLNGEITPVVQDASRASQARKIRKEDGLLSLDAPAEENWNKYRAYADSIGTYFFENGKRMKITSAEFAGGKFRVLRVIPEGKREMGYATKQEIKKR
ncbi:MAG: methionyl-tRNA formyltransferase [Parcubacteria group bacterium Gr01-1014_91]|nr:MAG: methionyl-tRNA formyltransferase [Parcubacteria group bacterium Gr01-1014_91]